MKKNLLDCIENQYADFSKAQKKLADFIRENLYLMPFDSIVEVSRKSGVSTASITRFTKELGFGGYIEFQKAIGELVRQDLMPFQEIKSAIYGGSENLLLSIIQQNIQVLQTLYSSELEKNFSSSVKQICSAKHVYIAAKRSSHSVGYYLWFMLKNIMKNVTLVGSEDEELTHQLCYVDKEDCLLSISFARYTRQTYEITRFFHEKGCQVIAITDSRVAPVARISNTLLIARTTADAYSFVGAMTLANALVTAVGQENRDNSLELLACQNRIAEEYQIYL